MPLKVLGPRSGNQACAGPEIVSIRSVRSGIEPAGLVLVPGLKPQTVQARIIMPAFCRSCARNPRGRSGPSQDKRSGVWPGPEGSETVRSRIRRAGLCLGLKVQELLKLGSKSRVGVVPAPKGRDTVRAWVRVPQSLRTVGVRLTAACLVSSPYR